MLLLPLQLLLLLGLLLLVLLLLLLLLGRPPDTPAPRIFFLTKLSRCTGWKNGSDGRLPWNASTLLLLLKLLLPSGLHLLPLLLLRPLLVVLQLQLSQIISPPSFSEYVRLCHISRSDSGNY